MGWPCTFILLDLHSPFSFTSTLTTFEHGEAVIQIEDHSHFHAHDILTSWKFLCVILPSSASAITLTFVTHLSSSQNLCHMFLPYYEDDLSRLNSHPLLCVSHTPTLQRIHSTNLHIRCSNSQHCIWSQELLSNLQSPFLQLQWIWIPWTRCLYHWSESVSFPCWDDHPCLLIT